MKTILGVVKDPPIQYHPNGRLRDARNAAYANGVYTNTWGVESKVTFGDYIPIGELVLPDETLLFFLVDYTGSGLFPNRIVRVRKDWSTEVINTFDYGWTTSSPIRAKAKYTRELNIEVVFTDAVTRPRLITIEINQTTGASTGILQDTLADTLLFPEIKVPTFELNAVGSGGGWKAGTYQVSISYQYDAGEGFTNWVGLSNIIVVEDNDASLSVNIRDFDEKFDDFKIAVLQQIDEGTFAFETNYTLACPTEYDADSILSRAVTIVEDGMNSIDPIELLVQRPSYDRIGDFTTAGGRLYAADLSTDAVIDYQEYANDIEIGAVYGDELPLDTKQGSYADPLVIYNRVAFQDNEVYAFFIRWYGMDGVALGDWFIPAENLGANMSYHQNDERYPADLGYPTELFPSLNTKYIRFHKFTTKELDDHISTLLEVSEPTPAADNSIHKTLQATDVIRNKVPFGTLITTSSVTGTYGTVENNAFWKAPSGDPLVLKLNVDITATTKGGAPKYRVVLWRATSKGDEDTHKPIRTFTIEETDYFAEAGGAGNAYTATIAGVVKIDVDTDDYIFLTVSTSIAGSGSPFFAQDGNWAISGFWSVETDTGAEDQATIYTKPTGITVSNIQVPQGILDKVQGFEILYAKRTTANSRVIEEGYVFPKEPFDTSTIGTEQRVHAFGLLLDKPSLSITNLKSTFVYEVRQDPHNERLLEADILPGYTSPPASIPVEDWNLEVVDQKYIQYNNSAQENKGGEGHIRTTTRNGAESTLSDWRAAALLLNEKTNYYQPFDAQIRLTTGRVFRLENAGISSLGLTQTSIDPAPKIYEVAELYGGDTYTNLYETRISEWPESNTALQDFIPWKSMVIPVRSRYNMALRRFNEDIWYEAAIDTLFPPDEAVIAQYPDYDVSGQAVYRYRTAMAYDTYIDMNRGHIAANLTRAAEMQGSDIDEYPYRVIRSPKQNVESELSSWRIFLPDDYYEQNRDRGTITNLATLDTDKILIHHERGLFLTKGSEKLATNVDEVVLGTSDIFDPIPKEPVFAEEGYLGSDKKFFNKTTRLGYVFETNGRIFILSKGLKQISEQGMSYYFRDLIDGIGDNPYLQNTADPNYTGGMSVAYDDRYDRLMISFNKGSNTSETWSYATKIGEQGAWESQFDYIDTKFFNTSKYLLAVENGQLFQHNIDNRAVGYDGQVKDTTLTAVFSEPADLTKHYFNVGWNTSISTNGVYNNDKTFSKIQAWNSEIDLGEQDLDQLTSVYTPYNLRRSFRTWRFNKLRLSAVGLAAKRRFVDMYLAVKLTYDNTDQDDLEVNEIDVGLNQVVR